MSANCDNIISGFFKSILAIPTSPLARPLPSTTATITDATVWAETADEDVTAKQSYIFSYIEYRLMKDWSTSITNDRARINKYADAGKNHYQFSL